MKQPAALEKFLTTHENLPAGDYVSPTLKTVVNVDSCFPNKILGNINNIQNPFFRKSITHNWYVDKNFPECGFLTRDEAHILLHCALLYQGKNALEIGSHTGWSTIHLALAVAVKRSEIGCDRTAIEQRSPSSLIHHRVPEARRCSSECEFSCRI
jgi:hypothetical protein